MDGVWMPQQITEILPDDLLKLLHGDEAIATFLFTTRVSRCPRRNGSRVMPRLR